MENKLIVAIMLVCTFMLGAMSQGVYTYYNEQARTQTQISEGQIDTPLSGPGTDNGNGMIAQAFAVLNPTSTEVASPKDRVAEDQIIVMKDKITLNIPDAKWASFTDTNSMDPVLDDGANAIEITPKNEEDIQVGDIVAYETPLVEGTVIHRVAYIGKDEKGTYFVMRGDNNPTSDPGKIRFSQIKRVVVAIIY